MLNLSIKREFEEIKIRPEEKEREKPFDVVIVYGIGPQPEKYLLTAGARINIEAAAFLYREGKVRRIIVTGGKTGGEKLISEGKAMAKVLEEFGIPKNDIIVESQAKNTIENVAFVSNIIDQKPKQFGKLLHLGLESHKERIKEITNFLNLKGKIVSAEEILLKRDPQRWGKIIKRISRLPKYKKRIEEEPKWIKALKEVPIYWLPQSAKVENLERFRNILKNERIKVWLKEKFDIQDPNKLSEEELKNIREKIRKMEGERKEIVDKIKTGEPISEEQWYYWSKK